MTTTTTIEKPPSVDWAAVAAMARQRWWNAAVEQNAADARNAASARAQQGLIPPVEPSPAPHYDIGTAASLNISQIMACIRAHESGDYGEHSHPGSSSGAYQFLGSTWRAWSARAGYPGYQLAYMAPPSVQDAVTEYALENGGAGNWSLKFGFDPCTAGLPGGG